jgi:3-hydroxyisobutyrate dehydrogenase
MRYGWVGLGQLGAPLAASLVREGFSLTVTDLDPDRAKDLLARGAGWADHPRDVARQCDAVFTCLPSPAASEAVLTGADGILAGLAPGGAWIEMSTVGPEDIRRLAAKAAERGIATLEAPVTGGVHRAAAGEITVLVGGEDALFRAHLPALEAMGGAILPMGPLGSAALVKVITNMLAFVHLVAAGEALALARRGGLDLGRVFHAIKESSGNSFVHETESQLILNGSYDIGFSMDLAAKDLGLAMLLGGKLGVPLDLAAATSATFDRARRAYGGAAPTELGRRQPGAAAASASRSLCSRVWSSDVRRTVPPTPFSRSRTLSPVTFLTRTKSTASPGFTSSATDFMNLSLTPMSVSDPARAPEAAPAATPRRGLRNSIPMRRPQKPPLAAPTAVVDRTWLSLMRPSASLTAIAASPSSIRYSFCSSNSVLRTSSAFCSDGKTTAMRSAMSVSWFERTALPHHAFPPPPSQVGARHA